MSNSNISDLHQEVIWIDNDHLAASLLSNRRTLFKRVIDKDSGSVAWLFYYSQDAIADIAMFNEEALDVNAHLMWQITSDYQAKVSKDGQ